MDQQRSTPTTRSASGDNRLAAALTTSKAITKKENKLPTKDSKLQPPPRQQTNINATTQPIIALAQPQYFVENIQPLMAQMQQEQQAYARGDIYRTAREDALLATAQNQELNQLMNAEVYREPRVRTQRQRADDQQISAAFVGIVPQTFFNDLQANNANVSNLVKQAMSVKNSGGVAIRMPKSRGAQGQERVDIQQARRILRALRGAMQAKLFRGARFNTGLLEAKARLSSLKKLGDPHGFIVQLRSYIKKYGSTNPATVLQQATNRVEAGLDTAKANIMEKVRGGIRRVVEFPTTSTVVERQSIAAAKRAVAAQQAGLGIPGGYQAAPAVPWEQFNRI